MHMLSSLPISLACPVLLRSSGLHRLNGKISYMKRITVPYADSSQRRLLPLRKAKGHYCLWGEYGSRVGVEDRGGRKGPNVANMVDTNPCPPTKDCPPFCWRTATFQHQHAAPQHDGLTVQYCSHGARFATQRSAGPWAEKLVI